MLLYFSYHYTPLFFFINLCLFTYKGKRLFSSLIPVAYMTMLIANLRLVFSAVRYYYPGRLLGWELTTIFLFLFIDGVRLVLGKAISHQYTDCETNLRDYPPCTSVQRKQDLHDTSARVFSGARPPHDRASRLLHRSADIHVRNVNKLGIYPQRNWLVSPLFFIENRLRVDIVINAIAFFLLGTEFILCAVVCLNIFLASRKF